jgi:serine/threonine protein kinase
MDNGTFNQFSLYSQAPFVEYDGRSIAVKALKFIEDRERCNQSHVLFFPENVGIDGDDLLVIRGGPNDTTPPQYMVPGASGTSRVTMQQSMWSVGVMIYCSLIGVAPPITFKDGAISGLNTIFDQGHPSKLSEQAKTFIGRLLAADPKNSPTPQQALDLVWLKSQRDKYVLVAAAPENVKGPIAEAVPENSPEVCPL